MRILVVFAHPDSESYVGQLHKLIVDTLRAKGHEVDDCDLYREQFGAVLSLEEWRAYGDKSAMTSGVERDIERVRACQGIVFVFPAWYYGMPAMLKGYFDRVWLPGVAFEVNEGRTRPLLQHIERFAVVTTFGASRWLNDWVVGGPTRLAFMRGLAHLVSRRAQRLWLAQYGMDAIGPDQRERFRQRVQEAISRF
jgi:NAD(P)H dehydrogenase (quinone)